MSHQPKRNTSLQSNYGTQNFHKNSQRGRGAFTFGRNNSERLTSSNPESIPEVNAANSNPCSSDFEFNKSLDNSSELGPSSVKTQSGTFLSSTNDGIDKKSWDEKPKESCIKEIDDDLFSAPDHVCLVHCVAADFRMGSGISVMFRNKFQSVGKLLDQRVKPGGVAHIQNKRHIFYLVTKELSSEKPTKRTMKSSLDELYKKCRSFRITELAMPKIGCGRDGLIWDNVKEMLEQIFIDDFTITVYSIEDKSIDTPTYGYKSRVENHFSFLKDVPSETGLLYIANLKSEVSAEMKSLHERHKFLHLLDKKRNKLGKVEFTRVGYEIFYGLFCKKSETSLLKYEFLENAIDHLKYLHERTKNSFKYYAIQAFKEKGDPYVMEKIDTLFRNSQISATFCICWPPFLERPVAQDMSDVDNNYEKLPMEIENTKETRVAIRQESTSNTAIVDDWNPDNSLEDISSAAMAKNACVENERRQSKIKKDAERIAEQGEKQISKTPLRPQSCVTEYNGDLFDAEKTVCLAHCVGADFRMGSGIAVLFRQRFGKVEELLQQGVYPGGVAHIKHEERDIFYLVTKMESTGKPTYDTLERSLHALHKKCKELNVTELAMPRIGCGLDRLDWKIVKNKLEKIFADGFTIRVYNLERNYEETPKSRPNTFIKIEILHLKDLKHKLEYLYIGCADDSITEEMETINEKSPFLMRLRKDKPKLGSIVMTEAYPKTMVIGLICKQSPKDKVNFLYLKMALRALKKEKQKQGHCHFAIQAFEDKQVEILMLKLMTMLKWSYIDSEIWFCFPPNLEHLKPSSSSI
ncbi:uncharacterized protein LOC105684241 isoform X2 [Athalia rosae]|uniref:uncharacterized protein LOC105684241 isoform X2 n=1 Tax=Athalia rosae TaxID=37344 RepID=UPI0020338A92|nr:uncharacterized protein LOC105684241 isoform X2 [Athalia rosae]